MDRETNIIVKFLIGVGWGSVLFLGILFGFKMLSWSIDWAHSGFSVNLLAYAIIGGFFFLVACGVGNVIRLSKKERKIKN